MFSWQGFRGKLLWSVIGAALGAAAVPASALGSDKIANNARSVFERAGGTTRNGITQKKFQAAASLINSAMSRLARDGTLGGAVPPSVAIKRDLSQRETIPYTEFLDYFRGVASEEDLKIRRALVDQALSQQGAAEAAAAAAEAAARQAAADAERARAEARAANFRDSDSDRDRDNWAEEHRIRRESAQLELIKAELAWYAQHPAQPLPTPRSGSSNPQRPKEANPVAAAAPGNPTTPGAFPRQNLGPGGSTGIFPRQAINSNNPGPGGPLLGKSSGPVAGSPARDDGKSVDRRSDDKKSNDKKSDDKSKK